LEGLEALNRWPEKWGKKDADSHVQAADTAYVEHGTTAIVGGEGGMPDAATERGLLVEQWVEPVEALQGAEEEDQ
jgi:hypothetical protein